MDLNEKIVDVETGEEVIRPYSEEEIAEVEKNRQEAAVRVKEAEDKAAARSLILEKLGLTEEEAKVLLG